MIRALGSAAVAVGAVVSMAPQLPAQAASGMRMPTVALSLAPAAAVETSSYQHLMVPSEWHEGVSVGLRLGILVAGATSVSLQGTAFRGGGGRTLQIATAGLERRAGRKRQVPLFLGFGAIRQPAELLCIDPCPANAPRFGHNTRAVLNASIAIEWPASDGIAIGPELSMARALTRNQRYHLISLGVRLARRR